MSALIYVYTPNQVVLSADTLSVDLDKNPLLLVSKILPIPHLKTVLCGTGFKPIISKWYTTVMESIIGFDISALNHHAPSRLRTLLKEAADTVQGTTSIFHFGYSEKEQMLKGYAFRSENNFDQEELARESIGIKPAHPGIAEFYQNISEVYHWNSEQFHLKSIIELKRLDDELPISGRVGIGGEVQWLEMCGKGNITMKTIHQFPDFTDVYMQMLLRNQQ